MKLSLLMAVTFFLGWFGTSCISGQRIFFPLGRQISHYNLLQQGVSQLEFQNLLKKLSYHEEVIKLFAGQYRLIMEDIISIKNKLSQNVINPSADDYRLLKEEILSIKNQLSQNVINSACRSIAPSSAKIVLGKCYQVFPNALSFAAAKDVCNSGGGKLAEPTGAEPKALYIALTSAFPAEVTAIGTTGVWLGFYQGLNAATVTTPFTALSNPGVTVPITSFQIIPTIGAEINNAVVLDTPYPLGGTPFISADSSAAAGNTRAFICGTPFISADSSAAAGNTRAFICGTPFISADSSAAAGNTRAFILAALQTQLAAAQAAAAAAQATANAAQAAATAAAAPKCSAALAAIGKVIGNFCYTLGTTAKTFAAAQADCAANGGTLAEPQPSTVANGLSLYNSLKTAAVSAAVSPNLWISVVKQEGVITFSFASSGTALAAADQTVIFETAGGTGTVAILTPAAAGAPEAATLGPTGKYLNELQSATRLYICQNPAF